MTSASVEVRTSGVQTLEEAKAKLGDKNYISQRKDIHEGRIRHNLPKTKSAASKAAVLILSHVVARSLSTPYYVASFLTLHALLPHGSQQVLVQRVTGGQT